MVRYQSSPCRSAWSLERQVCDWISLSCRLEWLEVTGGRVVPPTTRLVGNVIGTHRNRPHGDCRFLALGPRAVAVPSRPIATCSDKCSWCRNDSRFFSSPFAWRSIATTQLLWQVWVREQQPSDSVRKLELHSPAPSRNRARGGCWRYRGVVHVRAANSENPRPNRWLAKNTRMEYEWHSPDERGIPSTAIDPSIRIIFI